mmetsp:Transcript_17010/g.51456  ORF Transcript_17010/g.51456 Transcript_17010/m.51456 type:complete len:224 (+) Transcript_17010:1611-2282(+)
MASETVVTLLVLRIDRPGSTLVAGTGSKVGLVDPSTANDPMVEWWRSRCVGAPPGSLFALFVSSTPAGSLSSFSTVAEISSAMSSTTSATLFVSSGFAEMAAILCTASRLLLDSGFSTTCMPVSVASDIQGTLEALSSSPAAGVPDAWAWTAAEITLGSDEGCAGAASSSEASPPFSSIATTIASRALSETVNIPASFSSVPISATACRTKSAPAALSVRRLM